jgi:hypothetical protein
MELTLVKDLLEEQGPFTSVSAEVGRTTEDARQQLASRRTTLAHDLTGHGVDEAVAEDLLDRLDRPPGVGGEVRRTLVATDRGVLVDHDRPGHCAWPESLDHGVLPDLSAWLSAGSADVAFLLVVADRTGADLSLHRSSSRPPDHEESVTGEQFHITKVPEGDWAQKQFQQNAENAWQRNAELVVETIVHDFLRRRPRAVLLAGEERARAEVGRVLQASGSVPQDLPVIPLQHGGRAPGTSQEAMQEEVESSVARMVADHEADLAERLDAARGRAEGAHGLEAVLDALTQAQVDVVAVDLWAMREHRVQPGKHPDLPLPAAAREADELPADRVLVAAAALTGAELEPLPAALSHGGGVAALLRWET